MRRFSLILAVILANGMLHAQEGPSAMEPEIRRARPVEEPASPTGTENPEWMRRLPQAPPQAPPPEVESEPEAIPWRPPARSDTPQGVPLDEMPVRRAQPVPSIPVETPAPTPQPTPTPPQRETPREDEAGTIRLKPQEEPDDKAAELLASANSIYSRKMYEFAAMEYERFLGSYPQAEGREVALFRLGECYRMESQRDAARQAYGQLTREFREGAFFGAASYRLGEMALADKQFDRALGFFQSASKEAKDQEVRLSARYQSARCLDRLGKPAEAAAIYREVAAVETDNPYRDYARLALAESLASTEKKSEALAALEQIADGTGADSLKAEAAVKAGALAAELGDPKAASAFFHKTLGLADAGRWRPVAVLGAIRIDSTEGDFKEVAAVSASDLDLLTGQARAEALALVAAAYKELGSNLKAGEFYDRLAAEFPESPYAQKARFQKILGLYELGDKKARGEIEGYLAEAPPSGDRDRAELLLAEILFKEEDYAEAARLYESVLDSSLPDELKKQARYKKAWTLGRAGDYGAAEKAYGEFLERHPEASNVTAATVQRGVARQQLKNYPGALEDFSTVIEKWPEAPEREFALQQKAMILGQVEDYAGMKSAFEQFLKEFPETSGAAQAEFMIGWADFELKDYQAAAQRLERARQIDPGTLGEKAGLRLLLSYYYLEDSEALTAEAAKMKPERIPREVLRWMGMHAAQEKDFESAERYLALAVSKGDSDPGASLILAQSQNAIGKHEEALATAEDFLSKAQNPQDRARGLLVLAEAQKSSSDFEAALDSASEALRLQPEGRINAAGRLTVAEIEYARGDYDGAARAFMTVALLYDDPEITPRALQRAAESYRRSNNIPEAEKAFNELRERFPDHPLGTDTASTSPR